MKCFVVNQKFTFFKSQFIDTFQTHGLWVPVTLNVLVPPSQTSISPPYLRVWIQNPAYLNTSTEKSKCNNNAPSQSSELMVSYALEQFTKVITWYKKRNKWMSIYLGRWEKAATETKVWAMNQTTYTLMEFLQLEKPLQRLSETLLQPKLCVHFKVNTLKLSIEKGLLGQSPASMLTFMSRDTGSEEESAKDNTSQFWDSECKLGLPLSSMGWSSWGLGQTAGCPRLPSHLYSGMGSTGHRVGMPLSASLRRPPAVSKTSTISSKTKALIHSKMCMLPDRLRVLTGMNQNSTEREKVLGASLSCC